MGIPGLGALLAAGGPNAVAGAQPTAATHATLAAPSAAQVVDLTDVLVIAKRFQSIAKGATCATWTARASGSALRAGFDELAELSKHAELRVNELVALEVLGGAICVGLT